MPESYIGHRKYFFGDFTLDVDRGELLRAGTEVNLRPKSFDVLAYLVDRQGKIVSRDELLDTIWRDTIVTEDAVTQCLIDIRRAIGDTSQTMIRTVPRRGYIFELPVDRRSDDEREPGSFSLRTGNIGPWKIGLAAIMLAGIAFSWWTIRPDAPQPAGFDTDFSPAPAYAIAVLPFEDLSAAGDQAYFADGISEDILNLLGKQQDLRVIARTSSFSFRDEDANATTIAEQLGVTHLLEGSVRRDGDDVRINVQLIDALTGQYLWTESFDRQLSVSSIFAIQREIASTVNGLLSVELSASAALQSTEAPTSNLEALEEYFRGRQRMETRRASELSAAVDHFKRAIELDPQFALAYVALSDVYRLQTWYGAMLRNDAIELMDSAVTKALHLDSGLGQAYVALGTLQRLRFEYAAATESYDRALELSPNYAPLYQWYAEFLALDQGFPYRAMPFAEMSVTLDPRSPIIIRDYGKVLATAGQHEPALAQLDKALELDPAFAAALVTKANIFRGTGRPAEAILAMEKAIELNPGSPAYMSIMSSCLLDIGEREQAALWVERARRLQPEHQSTSFSSLQLNVYNGNMDAAAEDAQALLSQSPGFFDALRLLRDVHLDRSDPAAAKRLYQENHPGLFFQPEPEFDRGNFHAAIDLAYLLRESGEAQRAEALLERSANIIGSISLSAPCCWRVSDVKLHAIRGDHQAALFALGNAIDNGWSEDWWFQLDHDRALDDLRDEPGFQALRERLRVRMETERQKYNTRIAAPIDTSARGNQASRQ